MHDMCPHPMTILPRVAVDFVRVASAAVSAKVARQATTQPERNLT